MIRLTGVSVVKDRTILNDLNAFFEAGSIVGILGPSGSGKTTLMRSIVGFQKLTTGTIEVFGLPAGSAALRSRIGYSTQSSSIYADLTVQENVAFFSSLHRYQGHKVEDLLERLALTQVRKRLAGTLSGGERTRLALATALVGSPDLLVLDEPTVGLDPVLREQLWRFFEELAKSGSLLLVSSHVMDEAEHCDQICLLRDGQILAQGSLEQLKTQTDRQTMEAVFLSLVTS